MKTSDIVKHIKLPRNEIIFLHVRLKGICETTYSKFTIELIEQLTAAYSPKTILIPSYTYSFTNTGVYDIAKTKSETGRFGEEARLIFGKECRTFNPVFSVIDTLKYIQKRRINENTAFGADSLFEVLAREGYIIVNINLEYLITTHLHFLENQLQVPYRFEKIFEGTIFNAGNKVKDIKFDYFVRDLASTPELDRRKIEKYLMDEKAIYYSSEYPIKWLHSFELDRLLVPEIQNDPLFLLKG